MQDQIERITYQKFAERLLTDEQFRTAVVRNPAKALADAGIATDPGMIESLSQVDLDTLNVAMSSFSDPDGTPAMVC